MTLPKIYLRDLFWLMAVMAVFCAWWFQRGQLTESRRLHREAEASARNAERIQAHHQRVVDAYLRDGRLSHVQRADGSIYVTERQASNNSVFGLGSE